MAGAAPAPDLDWAEAPHAPAAADDEEDFQIYHDPAMRAKLCAAVSARRPDLAFAVEDAVTPARAAFLALEAAHGCCAAPEAGATETDRERVHGHVCVLPRGAADGAGTAECAARAEAAARLGALGIVVIGSDEDHPDAPPAPVDLSATKLPVLKATFRDGEGLRLISTQTEIPMLLF